ncbi:MAG: hypothetical protein H8E25_16620 [Planctomycetes bacterium]|nr:hypothetical protein [Planctomycetota bacterium]
MTSPFSRIALPSLIVGSTIVGLVASQLTASANTNLLAQPDVIVGDIYDYISHGKLGSQSSFSFGSVSCNIGNDELTWTSWNNNHPVIATNLYRLKDGVFEQIGINWIKHGFAALDQSLCNTCNPTGSGTLGIGCSDPYSAWLNGFQSDLGPRSEVNAYTGYFPYPPLLDPSYSGRLARRVVVDNDDLDQSLNPGARYFVEIQYLTPEDCAILGNGANNVSWREVAFSDGSSFGVNFVGNTHRAEYAIDAWKSVDSGVQISELQWPNDGSIYVASNAKQLPSGDWQYSYTVYNRDSDKSVRAFAVPIRSAVSLSNKHFNDIDYHSDEVYNIFDWFEYDGLYPGTQQRVMAWVGGAYNNSVNNNAVRWGTSYSYSFVANSAPQAGRVAVFSFKPGAPPYSFVNAQIPQ